MTQEPYMIKECLTKLTALLICIDMLSSTYIPIPIIILSNEHNI